MSQLFELTPLPYAFDAVEPAIDALTMEIHHDKHHATYVANLNKALESQPELQGRSIEDLLRDLNTIPEAVRMAVRNNGGGHANHSTLLGDSDPRWCKSACEWPRKSHPVCIWYAG